jgi:hypothetical protein
MPGRGAPLAQWALVLALHGIGNAEVAPIDAAFNARLAFVMSGDTAPEQLREAQESGRHLLHKPVQPMILRAMMSRFLKSVHA